MIEEPIIENVDDILLPPLHIKLGIVKKFIETVVKNNDEVFECLKNIFPKLSDQKIKAGNVLFDCLYFPLRYFALKLSLSLCLFLFYRCA